MFNTWLSAYVSKYIDDIPDYLKMDKYEMLDEVAMEFVNGDITYSELCDEYDLIEEMFADEEGQN